MNQPIQSTLPATMFVELLYSISHYKLVSAGEGTERSAVTEGNPQQGWAGEQAVTPQGHISDN